MSRKGGGKQVLVMHVLDLHFIYILRDCIECLLPRERSRDWGHARWKANICSGWRKGRDDFAIFHVYTPVFAVSLEKVRTKLRAIHTPCLSAP